LGIHQRNELYIAGAYFLEEAVNFKRPLRVCAIDNGESIELNTVLFEYLQTGHHPFKRRILFLIDAVRVVQVAGAVDTQTNKKPVHVQELAPLVIKQRAVSLQGVVDRFPMGIFGLQCHHLAEEFHSKQGWLASLPGKGDLCDRLG